MRNLGQRLSLKGLRTPMLSILLCAIKTHCYEDTWRDTHEEVMYSSDVGKDNT